MNATLLTLALALSPGADPYPNPDILVEADALKSVDPKTTVILDARDAKAYAAGHVPGAVPLPLADFAKAVPDTPEAWADKLGKLGVKADTPVVVYAAADVREGARAWWLLKYAGADKVRLLNGGYPAWEKAGGKAETTANEPKPVAFGKPAKTDRLAEKENLLSILKDKSHQILDARSNDEYCGAAGKATRLGHIPGAIQLEWSELLTADKKFKSPDELKKLIADRKINLDQPAVTYCQGGGRAAVLAFGLELMGAKSVKNYYKSWGEWGNATDTPVEVPKK
ncbi:MAG TPA: sulfurtransferase [Gemmataceae bacterium]|nr:sulfurtransferase [Gemmataceae bacterium]